MVGELSRTGTDGDGLDDPAVEVLDEQRHASLAAHPQVRVMTDERDPERSVAIHGALAVTSPATASRSSGSPSPVRALVRRI